MRLVQEYGTKKWKQVSRALNKLIPEIDSHGVIIKDRTVMINLQLADRDLQPMLHRIAVYQHDNNGTTPAQCQLFHGVMGCNGQVTVRFTSPVRLWLLEKEQE